MQPDSTALDGSALSLQGMDLNIVSLVSVGQHPTSGRARRAEQDGRAVELGMVLTAASAGADCTGADNLTVLHAGDHQQPSLRSYAGMGLPSVRILQIAEQDDAVAPLYEYLQQHSPDIVLTGVRAESGESSGMVPYLLAEKLGWPLVPRIANIVDIKDGVAEVLQALPRGQRRALKVRLPFVASVDNAAPQPRQSAFGPASRAELDLQQANSSPDTERSEWREAPARKRPKRLKVVKAKTAADRFKAATAKSQGGGGKVLKDQSASEQAQAIFDLLLEEGVVR